MGFQRLFRKVVRNKVGLVAVVGIVGFAMLFFVSFYLKTFHAVDSLMSSEDFITSESLISSPKQPATPLPETTPDSFEMRRPAELSGKRWEISCPENMVGMKGGRTQVVISDTNWETPMVTEVMVAPFCIDQYEASQPDATASFRGSWDGEKKSHKVPAAQSKPGVLPWNSINFDEARKACKKAGKRLPTLAEWQFAYSSPDGSPWPWAGENWRRNSCYVSQGNRVFPAGGCGFLVCDDSACSSEPVFDMVGNLSEWVDGYWQEPCFGQRFRMVAGGASAQGPQSKNIYEVTPQKPGCYDRFWGYGLSRSGLHFHPGDQRFPDDGFRCATDPK